MRYKVLQFWARFNTTHPFGLAGDLFEKLTNANYIYLM